MDRSATLQGVIVNYRRGPKTQQPKECLLKFPSIESASKAARLVGRKVIWTEGKHECRGKIVALHGKNGVLRARFRKGVPGHALGDQVRLIG